MMSCFGKVKFALRSSPAARRLRGRAHSRSAPVRPGDANASQPGVASMTPLRALMNSMLQPTIGSMRAVPPMSNAFDARTSTP